jgi:tail sheath protein
VQVSRGVSTLDNSTAVANLSVFVDDIATEQYRDLTMDPDDTQYLPFVLQSSSLIRAHDLFVRSRATSFPAHMVRPVALSGGTSPLPGDYQDALDRLESAEEVDMVIASVANQFNQADVRAIHQQVVAHCTKMGDLARNRIGIGAVTAAEARSVGLMIDHADDVRSDNFILSTPAASEGAVAGLLARQDYFQSPTFKNIINLEGPPGAYTDSQLEALILANIAAINTKRGLGIIVIKGLLTSGRQISVQRTANKSVRDVKGICDKYIGLLNNDGTRNALRQQITALLLQMARDGALVPSTDGKSPPFTVDVYSTQADFDNGIVRVDLAVRPVRAVDYIYATILVQN